MITLERLKKILHYDSETGVFTWKIYRRHNVGVGSTAGSPSNKGYIQIKVDGVSYKAHRLAWFYVHGRWPVEQIDHINQIKGDNRICNLREATNSQNVQHQTIRSDNTSGYKGLSWHKLIGKWYATITVEGKNLYKSFSDKDDAVAWLKATRESLHGEFTCHG
ncbi:HNH endonuclease [Yersinia sp. 1252 StPb PI]|uniref:HNH endonuclease n=1 Tax=Yersinia sp. 1252 StPb PI TaxID=3117404 RepID=UPI003B2899AD